MMTHANVSSREQSHPGSVEMRWLIAGGLLLLALFLLLFAPAVGVGQGEALGRWLRNPLQELTASLAALVAVLCLLRWRVADDAQALRIGLAMALYGVGTLGATAGRLAALQPVSRLAVIALLGYGLLAPLVKTRSDAAQAALVTLVTAVALTTLSSRTPGLGAALPAVVLLGLGAAYVTAGVREGRQLFAWTGVVVAGLALTELRMAVPPLADSARSLDALSPAALLLGVLASYRDIQQAFVAQRRRMLASQATALEAEALARDLRVAQEERAHEASSALLAIESATGTLERYRDLLDGDTREALAAALQAEIARLRALLDHAPTAQRPTTPFDLAEVLAPVVICANASGMRVGCAIASDLRGWGNAAYIAQVVQQLLVNAGRHAPGSPVEISAERDGDCVVVRVADHGPGVAQHLRERIFERGHRSAASAQAGGHGFGLAIARQLMNDQGGALWYEDRPGGGACFMLRLPAERNSALSTLGFHQYWG